MDKKSQILADITKTIYGGANVELKMQYIAVILVDLLDKLQKTAKGDTDKLQSEISSTIDDLKQSNEVSIESINDQLSSILSQLEAFDSTNDEVMSAIEELKQKYITYTLSASDKSDIAKLVEIPTQEKIIVEKRETIIEKPIITNQIVEKAMYEEPEGIRDKLQALEGVNRLDKSAIKGLEEEFSKLANSKSTNRLGINAFRNLIDTNVVGIQNGQPLVYNSKTSEYTYATGVNIVAGLVANNESAALANSIAIQAAVDMGGNVLVATPGDIYIKKTVVIGDYTSFSTASGSRLKRPSGFTSFHLIRNKQNENGAYVYGSVVSGGSITIQEPGHTYALGDTIFVKGITGNTSLNGVKVLTAVDPGVSYTYAATGSNPTNTAPYPATTTCTMAFTSKYNPIAGSNFVRTSNVTVVTEAGHQRGIGDKVYIQDMPVVTNTFNGVVVITDVTTTTWSYANTGSDETGTGTAHVLSNRGIDINVELHGNTDLVGTGTQWGAHAISICNATKVNVEVRDVRFMILGRVINFSNVDSVYVRNVKTSKKCAVAVQFDSYCGDKCYVDTIQGDDCTDDLLAWGVTAPIGQFGETAPSMGAGSMGTLTVNNILGYSPTGLLKLYCHTGYDLGRIRVANISGIGRSIIGDTTTGVTGGSFQELTIGNYSVSAYSPTVPDTIGCLNLGSPSNGGAWSNMGVINIDNFYDIPYSAASTGYGIYIGSPCDALNIDKYTSTSDRQNLARGISIEASTKDVRIRHIKSRSTGASGTVIMVIGSGTIVDNLWVDGGTHKCPTANNGTFVLQQTGGYIKNTYINGLYVENSGNIWQNNGTATSGDINVHVTNSRFNNVAGVINSTGTGNYNVFTHGNVATNVNNNFLQFFGAGITYRWNSAGDIAPAGKYVLLSGSQTGSLNGNSIKVDLGVDGTVTPAQIVPQVGDIVYNSNSTRGAGVYTCTATTPTWSKWGANAKGTATLVAGTVTVSNANVQANSVIPLTINTAGGTLGALYVSAKTVGTSFVITSTNVADTSVVNWEIRNS